MKKMYSTRMLTAMGMMAAITLFLTLVPKVPIPLGYAHLGNVAVFLFALRLPPRETGVAVAVGSALADFFGGFPMWILPTLLIKYGMAYIVWQTAGRRGAQVTNAQMVAGFVLASLWMAAGYTVFGALLYDGFTAALSSTPGLLMEGAVNGVIAIMLRGFFSRRTGGK